MQEILELFKKIELDQKTSLPFNCNEISLDLGKEIGAILYEIPSPADRLFADCLWFCPTLFSQLSFEILEKLISAVFLEKSIVFIGQQNSLSSAILGFNSLLYPFKWCLALVPILPRPLIEMLEAPLPLLVGISRREF